MAKRKHSGTVDATVIVNRGDDDEEITVSVSGYFEQEQNGGWDDPSWPASVELESAEVNGQAFALTESEKFSAIEALWSVVRGDD